MCDILNIENLKSFEDRYNYDVSAYIEEKIIKGTRQDGSKFSFPLSYLSWAYAQKIAKTFDPKFKWFPVKTENGSLVHDGMVLIEMTFLGVTEQHYYPILDAGNKAIKMPNAFDVNTAQMRGMTKLFSMMSGFGLKLYTGEDIKSMDLTGQDDKKGKDKKANTQDSEITADKESIIEFINQNKGIYKEVTETFKIDEPLEKNNIKKLQTLKKLMEEKLKEYA